MHQSKSDTVVQLSEILSKLKSDVTTCEAHGILTALLIANGNTNDWLSLITDIPANEQKDALPFIDDIKNQTAESLSKPDLSFDMLVSGEEEALSDRVSSLSSWCQGFLSGLGLSPNIQEISKKDNVAEILRDLVNISMAYIDDNDDLADESEFSYVEVYEYVRMSVLFLQESLKPFIAKSSFS